jgi:hypothetical protein
VMHDARESSQVGSCSGEPSRGSAGRGERPAAGPRRTQGVRDRSRQH